MKTIYSIGRPQTAVWLALVLLPTTVSLWLGAPETLASENRAAPASFSAEQESAPTAESIERGRVIVDGACSMCHDLDLVEEQRLSREDWGYVIQAMLANGSDLSNAEIPFVLDYLSTTFPPRSGED